MKGIVTLEYICVKWIIPETSKSARPTDQTGSVTKDGFAGYAA